MLPSASAEAIGPCHHEPLFARDAPVSMTPRRGTRWLAAPTAPWLIGLATIVLGLPSLWGGLALDDHVLARHAADGRPWWDLFRFADPTTLESATAEGMLGWWAAPDLEVEFWRPLSSWLHGVDFRVWDGAGPMHLESVLLYAMVVVLAGAVYRRLLGVGSFVGWATLLFAIDDTHARTVGWIANRSLVLATGFGLAALLAHDHWRRDGWRPGAVVGPVLLLGALASAEAGLTMLGYLVAYALCLDRGSWRRRLVALSPYLTGVVLWRLAYVHLGYGVVASGLYRDPGVDPIGVLAGAAQRVAVLGFAQFTLPISGPLHAMPHGWWWALLGLAGVGWWLWPLLRTDATARFFATGTLLAALPYATTLPSERLLLPLGLGGAGLVAQAVVAGRRRWPARVAVVLHLWISLLLFVPSLFAVRLLDDEAQRLTRAIGRTAAPELCVVVNVPVDVLLLYPPAIALRRGQAWPSRVYPLFAGRGTVSLERLDDRTIEMTAAAGWMASPLNRFARAADRPMTPGQRITLTDVVVEVRQVNGAGRPTRILARFGRPVDQISWVAWVDGQPIVWPVPEPHARYELATQFGFMPP